MDSWCARALAVILVGAVAGSACVGRGRYNPDLVDGGPSWRADPTVPQACGPGSTHGSIGAGTLVVLHPHRALAGDRNWIAAMERYVGRTTEVTFPDGRDPSGCPMVHVAVDGSEHYWRVRDLSTPAEGLGPGGGDGVPQRCDQDPDTAYYGLAQPGARVVLWRHRRFDGDSNWAEGMSAHVGAEARITELAGVDASGCPVVMVDVDGGEFVWRVRDLALVQPSAPQGCERGAAPDHGSLAVGAAVRLGRHRPVRGDPAWRQSMEQHVGRDALVTSLGPRDDQGCPVVHVDVDRGAHAWRVRDLTALGSSATGPGQTEPGRVGSTGIPEQCGQTLGSEDYGPIREGSRIVLARHRPVDGDENWTDEMNEFVGRTATVTSLSGSDSVGCPGVRVDLDGGQWFWRIRDVQLAP